MQPVCLFAGVLYFDSCQKNQRRAGLNGVLFLQRFNVICKRCFICYFCCAGINNIFYSLAVSAAYSRLVVQFYLPLGVIADSLGGVAAGDEGCVNV